MSNTRYDLESATSPFPKANLLYISSSRFGGDWHSVPHTHACLELFYCVRGTGQFYIAGDCLNVGHDDLVIINPGVEHTEVSLSDSPLEYIVLGIDGVEFSFVGNGELRYRTHNFRDKPEEILGELKTILREMELRTEYYETMCRNLLEIILVRIFRQIECDISVSSRHANKECAEVKRYMDANYAENITLDFLAELTHLNKYYLVHTFNREYGISPINYLIKRRIRESKYFLENTNYSLSQISGILGFSSSSYFSQSFKRLENISPVEYRKLHKANR
ncbi:MAG: AraC family transcriptional regulator [Angelakisella sp.]